MSAGSAPVTNNIEFAPLLPKAGSLQWETNQRLNRERLEGRRQRVIIPAAAESSVAVDSRAFLINGRNNLPAPERPAVPSAGGSFNPLFVAASLLLGWVLLAWKFTPEIFATLNQCFNPWAAAPVNELFSPAPPRRAKKRPVEMGIIHQAGAQEVLNGWEQANDEFNTRIQTRLARQRELLREIERFADDPLQKSKLVELCFDMGGLKDEAGMPEAPAVRQVASGLEGLLKELASKSRNVTPSALRSVRGGLDLIGSLCVPGLKPDFLTERPLKFLVVDDNLTSRQALSLALTKAFGKPDLAIDGEEALARATQQAYDAIFLDVGLPGMDGFEACTKIRRTALNRFTPVVFVTGQKDPNARVKSARSGGNDLMGKPFLIFEVAVKALTLALPPRLQSELEKPPVRPALARMGGFVTDANGDMVGGV